MFTSTKLIHVDKAAIYDMIYPLAAFENCKLSFDEFKRVIEGENPQNYDKEDVKLARNLDAACTYMLDTLNEQVSVDYAYRINDILTNGRIEGSQKRDHEISADELEYIQILKEHNYDLSGYDLNRLVPEIMSMTDLEAQMNVSSDEYHEILADPDVTRHEKYAYRCFMPMIKVQYFEKSNIITGALLVCKIVLKARNHMICIQRENGSDLGRILLACIYNYSPEPFNEFIRIMEKNRVEIMKKEAVKVMIHY